MCPVCTRQLRQALSLSRRNAFQLKFRVTRSQREMRFGARSSKGHARSTHVRRRFNSSWPEFWRLDTVLFLDRSAK